MRLSGRIAAAIEVLADIEARRRPVADALRDWGLSHRFAGSGDRAGIGNLVYDALRRRSSIAWRMGGDTPRDLGVGAAIFAWGLAPAELNAGFAEDAHAPESIGPERLAAIAAADLASAPDHVRADVPEWLAPHFDAAFGAEWVAEGEALAGRPPLDLRVNTLRAERDKVGRQLARLGAEPTRLSPVGLRIAPVDGPRRHPNVQAEEASSGGGSKCRTRAASSARCWRERRRAARCWITAPGRGAKRWRLRQPWAIAARSSPSTTTATGWRRSMSG
jgi:16S rRNA (cytosine967-C5)-methyltransferase